MPPILRFSLATVLLLPPARRWCHRRAARATRRGSHARRDLGQTTAEYALVLLGAAALALLLVAWATGSGKVDELFNAVFDHLISKAK